MIFSVVHASTSSLAVGWLSSHPGAGKSAVPQPPTLAPPYILILAALSQPSLAQPKNVCSGFNVKIQPNRTHNISPLLCPGSLILT